MTRIVAQARAAERDDGPRLFILIATGLLTGFLVAAIECL